MENTTKLKSCRIYEEDGKYYLDLKYTIEKIDGIYEKHIPKVRLSIPTNACPISTEYHLSIFGSEPEHVTRLHLDNYQFLDVEAVNGIECTEILVKKKTRKMTLAEIEKELGYSVEVVSKK